MIFNIISNLTKTKYHSHIIYIHNLANFNIIFLLNELTKYNMINLIIYKDKIVIVFLISFNKTDFRTYTIYFKDSYQLLLVSLSKLVKNFKVNT